MKGVIKMRKYLVHLIFSLILVFSLTGMAYADSSHDSTGSATATANANATGGNATAYGGQGGSGGSAYATIQRGAIENYNTNFVSNSNKIDNKNTNTNMNWNSQSQKQQQKQSQKQSQGQNNDQNISPSQSVNVITPRDFLGVPAPADVKLIPYTGTPNSLYSESTAPWLFAPKWTKDMVDRLKTCYFGCDTEVVQIGSAGSSSSFVIGKGSQVLAIIYVSADNPGRLWGNVANKALELGAAKVEMLKFISSFKMKSTGASFYVGGGLSTVYGAGEDKAVAGSAGIGFGTATAQAIESAKAAFVLYSK